MKGKKPLFSDNLSLFILFIFYMIQGIVINFFAQTLPIFMVEKGSLLSEIAVMNLLVLPFSVKLFFAPFLDVFFIKSFGRRKSYIVPTNYIVAGLLLALSFQIQHLIDDQNIFILAIVGLATIFPLSLQDIAVDGLGADLFTEENSIYPALAQTIGVSFGNFLASNLLVLLNSKLFCNKYIFSTEREAGILSVSHFLGFFGGLLLVLNIYFHFFLHEEWKEPEEGEKDVSLKEKIFSMKVFFTNPLLFSYILFLLFNRFAFSLTDSSFKLKLIQKGFPKEAISNILSVLLLVGITFQLLLPRLLKRTSEIGLFYGFFAIKLVENIVSYYIIENYEEKFYDSFLFWGFLIAVSLISNIQYNAAYGLCGSISNKISQNVEKGFEGTSIAFLTSVFNFGRRFNDYVSLSIVEKYDFCTMAVFGWVVGTGGLLLLRRRLLSLEEEMSSKFKKHKKIE